MYRFPLSDDVTKDYLIENLQNLVDLAGYSLKVFVCSTCTHKLQESHRVPCATPLSCTELIELEQEQHAELQKRAQRANEHAKQKAHWEAAMYEIELETQLPVLSVLRVLQAFASMGPTVDLKAELSRLLTDSIFLVYIVPGVLSLTGYSTRYNLTVTFLLFHSRYVLRRPPHLLSQSSGACPL